MKRLHPLLVPLGVWATACTGLAGAPDSGPETWCLRLSGQGPSDAVEWDFQVSAGRRAGEAAKLPVPSQWEQHGFGDYDYGLVSLKDRHREDGLYRRRFSVPESWRGRRVRVVFDGVMTDATVTVNGQQAGPVHQGAFYRFHHDITDKVRFGAENQLEVLVSKDSANPTVEDAERQADFWIFGGIFRPVWLEARPPQAIDWTAIDARADGAFRARVQLAGEGPGDRLVVRVRDRSGKVLGKPLESPLRQGKPVELAGFVPRVQAWSAEEPALYQVEFTLLRGGEVLHRVVERTGFRTFESRPGQGVFLNGRRITLKGINRHCFRPATGRALDPADSVADVRLIKSMNMNAVRCSHYSPDKAFLEACDDLGLYVIDELCTWQKQALDTSTARQLVGELVRRDVNHPSILWWANGNEGGWNTEVDADYALWDIRQRPVLHPWEEFSGVQTKHYPTWKRLQQDLAGPHLVMPTEYLHGLYDGGHGAGLEDYWNAITSRPNGIGGFLWVLADEGILRSDRNGAIDNWGTNAPDGIVGPHHEKEASYWTAKDIFCPVQIAIEKLPANFDGRIEVANRYDFRGLDSCSFRWSVPGTTGAAGELSGPAVKPGDKGTLLLPLPAGWRDGERLELTVLDRERQELWTWSWPVRDERERAAAVLAIAQGAEAKIHGAASGGGTWQITAGDAQLVFDLRNGSLLQAMVDDKPLPIARGPRLVGVGATAAAQPGPAKITHNIPGPDGTWRLEARPGGSFEAFAWTVFPDGRLDLEYRYRVDQPTLFHGITFDLPEPDVLGFSWTGQGPERVWANRLRGTRFGRFEREFRKLRPGLDFDYPHAAGHYAGIHSAQLRTKAGRIAVICHQPETFLRIGTNDEGLPLRAAWPEGDFSILHAIPAIGNKFHAPEQLGPQSMPHPPAGMIRGKVSFRFAR